MLNLHERTTTTAAARHGSGGSAAPGRRRVVGHGIAGLGLLGVLALLSACAFPLDVATDDDSDAATTSQSEGAPTPPAGPPETDFSVVSGEPIETPCWSYEGPQTSVNNISSDDEDLCVGALELWGEIVDGVVVPTGVGTVYGQVSVEPVRVSTSDAWGVGNDVARAADILANSYFAENGTVISLHEPTTLDGVPANITRVEGSIDETRTKAFITAFAPEPYTPGADAVQFFVIAVITPYDNGDELIDQVTSTWKWE